MIKEGGVADARPGATARQGESPSPARLVLVQHWFEELKRLVPTK
jgi:hypothetical protein